MNTQSRLETTHYETPQDGNVLLTTPNSETAASDYVTESVPPFLVIPPTETLPLDSAGESRSLQSQRLSTEMNNDLLPSIVNS